MQAVLVYAPQDLGVRLGALVYLAEYLLAALSEGLHGKRLFGSGR
jgi:hypothetical protein